MRHRQVLRREPAELDHAPAEQRIHDAPDGGEDPRQDEIAGRMCQARRDPAIHAEDSDTQQRRREHDGEDAATHERALLVRQTGGITARTKYQNAGDQLRERRQHDERAVDPFEQVVVLDRSEKQPRDRHDGGERRQDHQPVEQHVPHDHRCCGPRVRREQAELRCQVIAVFTQVTDRLRLGLECVRPRELLQLIERLRVVVHPGLQPTGDVAAAGDARQIVEALQDAEVREMLEHAEIEGRAADTAAGQADGRQRFLLARPANALVGLFE